MKSKIVILASVVALLTLPSQFAAQDNRNHISQKYHHYKLIDLGTLGGAQSTVTVGRALNNQGTVVGCADPPTINPPSVRKLSQLLLTPGSAPTSVTIPFSNSKV